MWMLAYLLQIYIALMVVATVDVNIPFCNYIPFYKIISGQREV